MSVSVLNNWPFSAILKTAGLELSPDSAAVPAAPRLGAPRCTAVAAVGPMSELKLSNWPFSATPETADRAPVALTAGLRAGQAADCHRETAAAVVVDKEPIKFKPNERLAPTVR